jgi:CelD/BcsL family acetyltransferase involved in cellulose biosynthesis
MIQARIVEDLEGLERYAARWDALAVAAGRPYCAPGWLLAWWRHAAPPGARLRVVVVLEDEELIGIAPVYAQPAAGRSVRLALLGTGASNRVEPLAAADRAVPVAGAITAALTAGVPSPSLLRLSGVCVAAGWPQLLAEQWPGRVQPELRVLQRTPAPTVDLAGSDYERWLGGKSRNFRQQMGRARRRLEAAGGRFRRIVATDEVVATLPELMALHRQRMSAKRERSSIHASVERMLVDAALSLAPRRRMWLSTIEAPDGRPISLHLFVSAGGEVAYWLGGFDDRWADAKPGIVVLVAAVEHAFALGAHRLDLGAGGQEYKRRLANDSDELIEAAIIPRGARYPVTRAQLDAQEARRRMALRLSVDRKRALRRVLRRSV